MKSIQQTIAASTQELTLAGFESAKIDVFALLCFVIEKPSSYLYTWPEKELTTEQESQFHTLLSRRLAGEPVAYLIGEREFWSLPLKVSPATLIPRPDTECLVELALEKVAASNAPRILDLGTGTGAIALALASELPHAQITGIDFNSDATQLAQSNALRLALECRFLTGNWFEPLDNERFDLIVSNPPYIDESDPHLEQGDVRYEPLTALVAPNKGLADIEHIIMTARTFLNKGAYLLIEHGYNQGLCVTKLFERYNYKQIATHKDYGGNDRMTLGQYQ